MAAMSDCEVVSETATQIMRVITVGKEGMMGNEAGAKLRERIELVEPFKVGFLCVCVEERGFFWRGGGFDLCF